jgi:hypothetical protein
MSIQVKCEQCGYKYNLKDELAGKKVKCKICKATFTVPAGSPTYVHAPRTKDFELAIGDTENLEHITNHVERYIGKIETVWHEIISDLVHIDVHWVQPTAERPYHTLVTSGMSDRPMTVPEGAENFCYGELVLCLPQEWPISEGAFKDEKNYWPIRLLKGTAPLSTRIRHLAVLRPYGHQRRPTGTLSSEHEVLRKRDLCSDAGRQRVLDAQRQRRKDDSLLLRYSNLSRRDGIQGQTGCRSAHRQVL